MQSFGKWCSSPPDQHSRILLLELGTHCSTRTRPKFHSHTSTYNRCFRIVKHIALQRRVIFFGSSYLPAKNVTHTLRPPGAPYSRGRHSSDLRIDHANGPHSFHPATRVIGGSNRNTLAPIFHCVSTCPSTGTFADEES